MPEKTAYIDSFRIRKDYTEFQAAQAEFDREVEEWNREVEAGQKEIERLVAELAEQSLFLSDLEQRERGTAIEARKTSWQESTNSIFGPGGRAEQRNIELTKPLLERINRVLEQLAREDGYIMIFDSVNGNLAYARNDLDITEKVLKRLESEK